MKENKPTKVNIIESTSVLAQLMSDNPSEIDRDLLKKGENLIAIFQDSNFSNQFHNLKDLKKEIISMAINDISIGVMTLQSATLGVTFSHSKLKTYISPHGSSPEGSVVYSLSWKNIKAFQNWRSEEESEITQDKINYAIYFLTFQLSKLV